MKLLKTGIIIVLGFVITSCGGSSPSSQTLNFAEDNGGITLPDNFKAVVVADSIGQARHITAAENGDLYVALSEKKNGGGIAALRDEDGDGKADQVEYFGPHTGTGIQLYNGYLYSSSDTSIVRFQMTDNQLAPQGEPEMVVEGFPNQSSHAAKSFTFDQSGNLYVNIGGPSNACQEEPRTPGSPGQDPCPQLENHGGIWQFAADEAGQTFQEDGQRYATGIRNSVALDWNNNADQLYVVQHGRDQLNTLWPDYFNVEQNAELPAEEMFAVNEGDNFGWPYVYYDWQKEQKMIAPEYGGDGKTPAEEDNYENPIIAFPGHWGPNDLLFYNGSQFPQEYINGAFIAFHGSWNRAPEPQAGYNVVFVPFEGENVSGDYEVFADGFKGQETLTSPGDAEARPTGLAIGPSGSLYVADSQNGKIWRIVYSGGENSQQ
ncbi:PQQ-dependent sugar dehydrogenase [Fodinibius sediminis]|uniref:Glucose/arabinose dehydrogenase, beta-propeller fold n=1 Tax=Fodinibius sediminis TaxID=1214077 RepID=A0A521CQT7_9BACT|nr:PQQ-dependent sugar dehydrogenase [Fodinibius sediminis]SMO61812.1 Glucose/arabinose dehydrogenase, beta-propeller fold [Fodinibius sediminis]